MNSAALTSVERLSFDKERQRLVVEVALKDPEFFTRDFRPAERGELPGEGVDAHEVVGLAARETQLGGGEVDDRGVAELERAHGADVYSTEMSLSPQPDGTYRANGEKYYIGNGNIAPMVSTFGNGW